MSDSKSRQSADDAPSAPRFFFGDERAGDVDDHDTPPLGRPTPPGGFPKPKAASTPEAESADDDRFSDARAAAEQDLDGDEPADSDTDSDVEVDDDAGADLSFLTATDMAADEASSPPSTPPPSWNPDLPVPEVSRSEPAMAGTMAGVGAGAGAGAAASGGRRGGGGGLMIIGMTVLALGGGAFMVVNAPKPVAADPIVGDAGGSLSMRPGEWYGSVDRGMQEAGRLDRPMLLFFTADWCGPCRQLKRGALSNGSVAGAIHDQFVPIKVDLTDQGGSNTALAQQFNVRGIPAMIVLDADGDVAAKWDGNPSPGAMVDWLDKAAKRAR